MMSDDSFYISPKDSHQGGFMKRYLMPALLIMLACLTGLVSAQTPEPTQIMRPTQSPMPTQTSTAAQMPEPTQTPYIIYVVVTATPEPDPAVQPIQIVQDTETPIINRVTEVSGRGFSLDKDYQKQQ